MENKNLIEGERDWFNRCPHDANGRHKFEPRYSTTVKKDPIMLGSNDKTSTEEVKTYVCDICTVCGITSDKINESLANKVERLERYFEKLRFGETTHLGLGDIRLSVAMQEEIINKLKDD